MNLPPSIKAAQHFGHKSTIGSNTSRLTSFWAHLICCYKTDSPGTPEDGPLLSPAPRRQWAALDGTRCIAGPALCGLDPATRASKHVEIQNMWVRGALKGCVWDVRAKLYVYSTFNVRPAFVARVASRESDCANSQSCYCFASR